MAITKSYVKAIITAIVLIAAATIIAFPNATVHATLTTTPEQTGTDDATTNATTTTTPQTAESQQQQQQQQSIHITKDSTNSYVISGGSSSVGSFDTTYRIAGERSAVRASEDLIITTITDDFRSSPTIGYVTAGTATDVAVQDTATLPNPFATPEQVTERITSELRRIITEAENNTSQGQFVEINCNFGMMLDEMHCHHIPLVGGAGGESAATNTTGTTDTTASSISP
jgi:hypothetical protein